MTREQKLELAAGLEHAARVMWTWLRTDESPWERRVTVRTIERFARAAIELRTA